MTLKYTRDEARGRVAEKIGTQGHPNAWWPYGPGTNDCLAFQLERLGVRTRSQVAPQYTSIKAFRAHFGWDEIPITELIAGDLVLEMWPDLGKPVDRDSPNHVEMFDAVSGDSITTTSGNTGPRPGVRNPLGVWKKTRPQSGNFIVGVRPPYRGDADTSPYGSKSPHGLSKREVRIVAGFLNARMGGDDTGAVKDGTPGPIYWRLVQEWGRKNGIYGPGFKIDGIVGPRTRQVEAVVLKRAVLTAKG